MANEDQSTSEIVERTIADTRRLVRKELELARSELLDGARDAARSGVLLAAGAGLALGGLGALTISLGLALPTSPARGTLFVSLAMLTGGAVCAVLGLAGLPNNPLRTLRDRLQGDVAAFSESGL